MMSDECRELATVAHTPELLCCASQMVWMMEGGVEIAAYCLSRLSRAAWLQAENSKPEQFKDMLEGFFLKAVHWAYRLRAIKKVV